ncbi:SMP-30/gluconolactonase/LRE family protein [Tropicimonas aquimaris]|uniref:SMP-30/gluconolactonase/LRE family protein n=1 Tax=Tropicimonas aquimaris TaxID=914152 RepID=A0ABW3IW13_9RHOB
MRLFSAAAVVATGSLIGSIAAAQEVVWMLEGLEAPESALFDEARNTLYVSNVNGEPTGKDGNGYISRVSPDGQMLEAQWVTGMDAPKGLVSDGTTLYVSDIDRLVAIDIESGEIAQTWAAEGAIFLNDTALDGAGRVFVSDMIADKIHVLVDGELSILAEGETLQHPNGLNMREGKLLVAPWGLELQEDFTTKTGGHLITVDVEDGSVKSLGSGDPVGNLDGLEPDGKGNWIVSDWIAGAVYRIADDGKYEMLLDLDMGSADLEFIPGQSLLIVPMMLSNSLVAYRIE